ncbi:MAG: tetraacyldisaccharide 4'-kinase, partial [Maritimibacter sp.]
MAPRFWHRPPGALMRLIGPLARGMRPEPTQPLRLPVPVIAVGSLSLGGTGKTPAVIAIAQRLVMQGKAVHVITRGPGAPMRVDEQAHSPAEIGDEPLLIAAFAPCWLGRDGGETARAELAARCEIVRIDCCVTYPMSEGLN